MPFGLLPHTKDIWTVDYMPIQIATNKFVQFKYDPDYLQTPELRETISDVDAICKTINLHPDKVRFDLKRKARLCKIDVMEAVRR